MESIQFTKQKEVLKQVYPTTMKQKIHKLWNKEIVVPLVPVSAIAFLLIVAISIPEIKSLKPPADNEANQTIIEVAGYYYWEDDYERALLRDED